MDAQLPNEGVCEDSEESSQPCLSRKKGRSKNFSIQEDMLLISAWENVSLDSIKGPDQKQTSYWSRVASYFDEHKSFVSERTPIALTNRWSTIKKSVTKFQGFYNQIVERNQSGEAENDKVQNLNFILLIVTRHSWYICNIVEYYVVLSFIHLVPV